MEALNFLDDVEQFKILYYEKATNWRKARFKIIVETYILPGANFEINISHAMRNKILKIYHENQQAQQNRISAGRVVNSNPMFAHSTL